MKRSIACLSLLTVLTTYGSALAMPQDEYDDSQSYPLRVAAYLLHPVGVGLEYAIFRPFHWLVSYNETTEEIFGHTPHGREEWRTLVCSPSETVSCVPARSSGSTSTPMSSSMSSSTSTSMSTSASVY